VRKNQEEKNKIDKKSVGQKVRPKL